MTDTPIAERTIAGQPRNNFEACKADLQDALAEIAVAHQYAITPAMLHRWATAIGETAVMLDTVLNDDTLAAFNIDSNGANHDR